MTNRSLLDHMVYRFLYIGTSYRGFAYTLHTNDAIKLGKFHTTATALSGNDNLFQLTGYGYTPTHCDGHADNFHAISPYSVISNSKH